MNYIKFIVFVVFAILFVALYMGGVLARFYETFASFVSIASGIGYRCGNALACVRSPVGTGRMEATEGIDLAKRVLLAAYPDCVMKFTCLGALFLRITK